MRNCLQTLVMGLIAVLVPSVAAARLSNGTSSVDVVQQYCQSDMKGSRLSSLNPDIDKMTALETWPVEPGWGSATVIKDFEIVRAQAEQNTSSVEVRYSILGRMDGTRVTASRQHQELVTFTLKKFGDKWKIDRPMIPPHVSAQAAASALRALLGDEKNAQRKKQINQGLATLDHWEEHADSANAP